MKNELTEETLADIELVIRTSLWLGPKRSQPSDGEFIKRHLPALIAAARERDNLRKELDAFAREFCGMSAAECGVKDRARTREHNILVVENRTLAKERDELRKLLEYGLPILKRGGSNYFAQRIEAALKEGK